jgi:hypothetical protein
MKKRIFFLISLILLFSLIQNSNAGYSSFENEIDLTPSKADYNNKLDFSFLLHANQANVPYGDVANDLNYYHVMKVLRQHPNLHFPLHFSGTLLTDLAWFNQSTLDYLRDGYNDNQFEIIGSTYAQNIMYSHHDNYDNTIQIEKHQQVIESIIGAEPIGFWNPERCWNQSSYVDLLVDNGYNYTFIEDQILEQSTAVSGMDEYKVRTTSFNGKTIKIVNDDKSIINLVDNIAFTIADPSSIEVQQAVDDLIEFLQVIYANDAADDYLVFYGQDMEAWGLWQEEGWNLGGHSIADSVERVTARLDYMLTRLEQESSWLNIVTPSEFINSLPIDYSYEHVNLYVDGQADWMQTPSQNEGFSDWFDFNENDSRLIAYRNQFLQARTRLKYIDSEIESLSLTQNTSAAENLMSYAKFVFAAHQFEFGCIGCYFPWFYGTKIALITAEAAYYSLNPSLYANSLKIDWDLDGHDEYILRNQKALFVFSGTGGRLINWFDLVDGKVLLANDVPATYSGVGGQSYPMGTPFSYPIDIINPYNLWGRTQNSYLLRQKSFNDMFWGPTNIVDEDFWKISERTGSLLDNSLVFTKANSDLTLTKQFILNNTSNSLKVFYTIENTGTDTLTPKIGLAFNPDNENLLMFGKTGLSLNSWEENSETHILINENNSKTSIKMIGDSDKITGIINSAAKSMFTSDFTLSLKDLMPQDTLRAEFLLMYSEEYLTPPISEDSNGIALLPHYIILFMFIGMAAIIVYSKPRVRLNTKN